MARAEPACGAGRSEADAEEGNGQEEKHMANRKTVHHDLMMGKVRPSTAVRQPKDMRPMIFQ